MSRKFTFLGENKDGYTSFRAPDSGERVVFPRGEAVEVKSEKLAAKLATNGEFREGELPPAEKKALLGPKVPAEEKAAEPAGKGK